MTTQATARIDDERLAEFVREALPCRNLVVSVSRADVRRLTRSIAAINLDMPDDPLDPDAPADLALALMGAALRGMDANDEEDGVWSGMDGRAVDLPRPNRLPLRTRLRVAWRAARVAWRAS